MRRFLKAFGVRKVGKTISFRRVGLHQHAVCILNDLRGRRRIPFRRPVEPWRIDLMSGNRVNQALPPNTFY
jgi:hypothetical protein